MFAELEKTTGNMTAQKKLAANYDLHFEFNSVLAEEMPVLVTGHVPKQLGWEAATHWGSLVAASTGLVRWPGR